MITTSINIDITMIPMAIPILSIDISLIKNSSAQAAVTYPCYSGMDRDIPVTCNSCSVKQ